MRSAPPGIARLIKRTRGARRAATRLRDRRSTQLPAALEVDAHLRNGTRSGKSFRVLQQAIASIEVVAQTGDPCELGEHLGAPGVFGLVLQLRAKPLLGSVQIVEIPMLRRSPTPQAIGCSHRRLILTS